MVDVRVATVELAEQCAAVQRGLRAERLGRRELSELEHNLEDMLDALKPRWGTLEHALGPTPEVRLARAALRALEESVQWAHAYRKHAPLRERRERVVCGFEGALGASQLLHRVAPFHRGPQIAECRAE